MSERLTTNVLDALDERAASGELADMLVPKATVRALVAEVRASRSVAAGDGGGFPRAPRDEAEREAVEYAGAACDEWAPGSMSGICTRLPGHDGDHVCAQFVESGSPDKRQHIVSRWPATTPDHAQTTQGGGK
jgi:hypothetical protein